MQLQSQSSRSLSEALQTAAKCISNKNTMAILDYVLLSQREDGQFLFTAATSDSRITIPAPLSVISGKFEKPIAIHPGSIISYLSTLSDCVINITVNENNTLTLDYCAGAGDKVKTGKVSMPYLDANEFPNMAGVDAAKCTHIVLPRPLFTMATEQAQNFCANDELRMTLNGLYIDIAEDMSECCLVSTDGHKLIRITHSNNPKTGGSDFFRSGTPCGMIIHNRYFKALSAFKACEDISIETDGNTIRFTSGDIEFTCKAIEGRYPNYNAVIPKDNAHYICFDKKEMLSAIKRVSIFGSDTTGLMVLTKDNMFLNVSAKDIDFSTDATDQVFITDAQCPDGFAIGLKASHLVNVVSAIDDDVVRLKLNAPDKAGVLTADTPSPVITTLIMPMLIQ